MYLVMHVVGEPPRDLAERAFDFFGLSDVVRQMFREFFGSGSKKNIRLSVGSSHKDAEDAVNLFITEMWSWSSAVVHKKQLKLMLDLVPIFVSTLMSQGFIVGRHIQPFHRSHLQLPIYHIVVDTSSLLESMNIPPLHGITGITGPETRFIIDEARRLKDEWVQLRRQDAIESIFDR